MTYVSTSHPGPDAQVLWRERFVDYLSCGGEFCLLCKKADEYAVTLPRAA